MPQSTESRSVSVYDIVTLPKRTEVLLYDRAANLLALEVKLLSYVNEEADERVDAWFKRSQGEDSDLVPPDEAISGFRWSKRPSGEDVCGPWVQVIDLGYEFFPVTAVHELAHLIDRYHLPPRTKWSSSRDEFTHLKLAYIKTRSFYLLTQISKGEFYTVVEDDIEYDVFPTDDESRKKLTRRAMDMLHSHEVFARCLTAYVFYKAQNSHDVKIRSGYSSLIGMFQKRVAQDRNSLSGSDLTYDDFLLIEEPMQELLTSLSWRSERYD